MAHSRGVLHKARFCPWCGVENIERDHYPGGRKSVVEFLCQVCGVGFRLDQSRRVAHANYLTNQARKQRPPDPGRETPPTFASISKRKYAEFKRAAKRDMAYAVGLKMREWIESQGELRK